MFQRIACRVLKSCLGVGLLLWGLSGATAPGTEPTAAKLPLKKVVLFSSGVGYFQHAGDVLDNARVELKFNVDDINDLLKSMVVQDLDGGRVSTVNYGSKDPVTKSLKSFAVDLTANPTLGDLLQQIRGERVEIDAPNKITGVIVGVEKRKKELEKNATIETDVLNLLTDEGLRAVPLDSVSRIKLVNPQLDAEFRKALEVLATAHATDKKAVALNFLGKGKRRAVIGYVQETPVWKTSYRLVLRDEKPPLLQGWAIVENTTEEDWSGVELTLVSGRPISFSMDLYQPLYVARPVVEMELYASLRPPAYEQDLARKDAQFRQMARGAEPAAERELAEKKAESYGGGGFGGRRAGAAAMAPAAPPAERARKQAADKFNFQQGVQSVAQAGQLGELFQYKIDTDVNLPRQQSAMLPIVNAEVKGQKVSIYDPAVHPKHPLNGLKLVNATDLHLMQGPITVFDGDVYAGDAKIQDLAPGAERLVSYAMDLETEVAVESKGRPDQLLSVRLIKGTMQVSRKYTRSQEYTVKNSGRKPKQVLIEYPKDATWTLVQPKEPAEKTRDKYRFAVPAKPGEPAKLVVEEERVEPQQIGLTDLDDRSVRIYLVATVVSEQVKTALREVVQRKVALEQLVRSRQDLEKQIQEIGTEQSRIRQNMDKLDRTSDLYKRYVKKFSDQEDQVEQLRGRITELAGQERDMRKAFDQFLIDLDVR